MSQQLSEEEKQDARNHLAQAAIEIKLDNYASAAAYLRDVLRMLESAKAA